MANPQKENGYIPIAKEIARALMQINIRPYETRVLWCVFWKTYGWHKKADRILRGQISKATGISKQNARKAINSLKDKNLVAINGGFISFNKDWESWKVKEVIHLDYHYNLEETEGSPNRLPLQVEGSPNRLPKVVQTDYLDPFPDSQKVVQMDSKVVQMDSKGSPNGLPHKNTLRRDTKEEGYLRPLLGELQNVKLTTEQLKSLYERFGEAEAINRIERLSLYIGSKGDKYKSHYATILAWERKDREQGNGKIKFTKREGKSFYDMTEEELEVWAKEEEENGDKESGSFSH